MMNGSTLTRQLVIDLVIVFALGIGCLFVPLYGILAAMAVVALVRGMLVAADRVVAGLTPRADRE